MIKKIIILSILLGTLASCGKEVDLSNPGKCIIAESQCNICSLNSSGELKGCTFQICNNEKFYCKKYLNTDVKKATISVEQLQENNLKGQVLIQNLKTVSVADFKKEIEKNDGILIDLRTDNEVSEGVISGAMQIDYYSPDFQNKINSLDKNTKYLIYCRSGARSGRTLELMKTLGFRNVINLNGGIGDWINSGEKLGVLGENVEIKNNEEKTITGTINGYTYEIIEDKLTTLYLYSDGNKKLIDKNPGHIENIDIVNNLLIYDWIQTGGMIKKVYSIKEGKEIEKLDFGRITSNKEYIYNCGEGGFGPSLIYFFDIYNLKFYNYNKKLGIGKNGIEVLKCDFKNGSMNFILGNKLTGKVIKIYNLNIKNNILTEINNKNLNNSNDKIKTITFLEVQKHNKNSDCWTIIDNKVYDITSFFGIHPGGDGKLEILCGVDGTKDFIGKHGENAKAQMKKDEFYIGNLK